METTLYSLEKGGEKIININKVFESIRKLVQNNGWSRMLAQDDQPLKTTKIKGEKWLGSSRSITLWSQPTNFFTWVGMIWRPTSEGICQRKWKWHNVKTKGSRSLLEEKNLEYVTPKTRNHRWFGVLGSYKPLQLFNTYKSSSNSYKFILTTQNINSI